MRDVAAVRRWFTGLVLLGEQLSGADRDLLAERATWVTLPAGARLHAEGQPVSALWFLVQGEIVLGGAPGDAVDGVVRRAVTTPGYPVGWDGVVWPGRHRWDAVAASRTVLLRVGREVIEDHCRADEGFAARLHRLLLWLAGPGATHDYTLRIARLAETGRAVVHYDKLGCGRSTHLRDRGPDFWTVQLFLDELDNLLDHLGIRDRYAVLGQSWGGMLGAEHAIRRPAGLTSLVIADSPASMDLWVSEANRLRQALPAEVQETLLRHEAAGTTDSAEYREAELVFYARHVCRIVPNPPEVTASFAAIDEDPTVYHTMNGPSEFHVIGTLRHWSVVDQVGAIDVPTLVVTGAHDEATPATVAPFVDGIPGARWEVFADSSHMPHVEEEDRYLQVVGAYLDEHDTTSDRTLSDRTPSRDWSQTA